MHKSDLEKDRPATPSSDSFVLHMIDEMPVRVVCAFTFVAFFFVWGGVNNVLKLFVENPDQLSVNYGLIAGVLGSIATPIVIVCIKRRAR
jgi:hypothetical protein